MEDAEPLRALTKEFLAASGYTILDAANGDEALRIAKSYAGTIDLLLTDVVMPRMSGKPLVEQAGYRPVALDDGRRDMVLHRDRLGS